VLYLNLSANADAGETATTLNIGVRSNYQRRGASSISQIVLLPSCIMIRHPG